VISIGTPTVTHADIAHSTIESGEHILVEKPLTNTVEETQRLIKAAEKHHLKLTVGSIKCFNPAVREAIKLASAKTGKQVKLT